MPQLSLENGNRIALLGSPTISNPDRPGLDLEAVMLTEVLEFALSLSPVPKNVEQFIGIPHLQAYRLALGLEYATFGLVDRANKFVVLFYPPHLLPSLHVLNLFIPFYTFFQVLRSFGGYPETSNQALSFLSSSSVRSDQSTFGSTISDTSG
jgi:hypothetical protein